jgi:hypothetical protein
VGDEVETANTENNFMFAFRNSRLDSSIQGLAARKEAELDIIC